MDSRKFCLVALRRNVGHSSSVSMGLSSIRTRRSPRPRIVSQFSKWFVPSRRPATNARSHVARSTGLVNSGLVNGRLSPRQPPIHDDSHTPQIHRATSAQPIRPTHLQDPTDLPVSLPPQDPHTSTAFPASFPHGLLPLLAAATIRQNSQVSAGFWNTTCLQPGFSIG